jgi:predicted dehydrogenase
MRIAMIGLGFMGSTHLKAYRNIPGIEISAVASVDPAALEGDLTRIQGNLGSEGERYDFSKVQKFTDAIAGARESSADAVDICLPTNLHAAAAIAALEAGKHVLVEKPMALDGAECARIIDAARASGRILMCAQVLRFLDVYQPLISAAREGKFGRIRHALFRRRCAAPAWSGWLSEKSLSGGGVFDLLIHDVDLLLHLFGPPESVSAWGQEDLQRGVDVITAQFQYPNIGSVTITGGWHHPKAYPFSMEYTVVGDLAAIEYSSAGRDPKWYGNDGAEQAIDFAAKDGYQAEIEYFIDCCRTGSQPTMCTPASSARAVELAALMSAARSKRGEPVPCRFSDTLKSE